MLINNLKKLRFHQYLWWWALFAIGSVVLVISFASLMASGREMFVDASNVGLFLTFILLTNWVVLYAETNWWRDLVLAITTVWMTWSALVSQRYPVASFDIFWAVFGLMVYFLVLCFAKVSSKNKKKGTLLLHG